MPGYVVVYSLKYDYSHTYRNTIPRYLLRGKVLQVLLFIGEELR